MFIEDFGLLNERKCRIMKVMFENGKYYEITANRLMSLMKDLDKTQIKGSNASYYTKPLKYLIEKGLIRRIEKSSCDKYRLTDEGKDIAYKILMKVKGGENE